MFLLSYSYKVVKPSFREIEVLPPCPPRLFLEGVQDVHTLREFGHIQNTML